MTKQASKQANKQANKSATQAPAPATQAPAASGSLAALVATVTATPTPVASAPAVVPVRGGLAIAQVKLGGKPYRVTAPHNAAWWSTVQAQLAAAPNGVAPVAAVVAAGVPVIMVGYLVRRGYLVAA